MNILQKADKITRGERNADYGHPRYNHATTASLWSAYLTRACRIPVTISAEDVCILNILQKVSRFANKPTEDTLVDIAGYARNIEMIQHP